MAWRAWDSPLVIPIPAPAPLHWQPHALLMLTAMHGRQPIRHWDSHLFARTQCAQWAAPPTVTVIAGAPPLKSPIHAWTIREPRRAVSTQAPLIRVPQTQTVTPMELPLWD